MLHLLYELVLHCQLLLQLMNDLILGGFASLKFIQIELINAFELLMIILYLFELIFQIRDLLVFDDGCAGRFTLMQFRQRYCVLN